LRRLRYWRERGGGQKHEEGKRKGEKMERVEKEKKWCRERKVQQ
jgi:hypothetical protein